MRSKTHCALLWLNPIPVMGWNKELLWTVPMAQLSHRNNRIWKPRSKSLMPSTGGTLLIGHFVRKLIGNFPRLSIRNWLMSLVILKVDSIVTCLLTAKDRLLVMHKSPSFIPCRMTHSNTTGVVSFAGATQCLRLSLSEECLRKLRRIFRVTLRTLGSVL